MNTKSFFLLNIVFFIEYCSLDLANILSNRNNLKSCGFNNNFLHLEECYEVHEVPHLVSSPSHPQDQCSRHHRLKGNLSMHASKTISRAHI